MLWRKYGLSELLCPQGHVPLRRTDLFYISVLPCVWPHSSLACLTKVVKRRGKKELLNQGLLPIMVKREKSFRFQQRPKSLYITIRLPERCSLRDIIRRRHVIFNPLGLCGGIRSTSGISLMSLSVSTRMPVRICAALEKLGAQA